MRSWIMAAFAWIIALEASTTIVSAASGAKSVTPQDFGARADGAANDLAALQKAINAGASTRSVVVIPKGVYLIAGSLILPSGATIDCQAGATLKQMSNDTVFVNANGNRVWVKDHANPTAFVYANGNRFWTKDDANPTVANMSDHDITVSGCTLDFTAATLSHARSSLLGAGGFAILLAHNIHIFNNKFLGNVSYGSGGGTGLWGNFIRMSKVYDSDVHDNWGQGLYNGFGFWGGGWNVRAYNNTWYIAQGKSGSTVSCANINGMDSGGYHQTISHISYDHNTCYIAGGVAGTNAVAYNNGTLSAGSTIAYFNFDHNTTIATGPHTVCYNASGAMDHLSIEGNRFENCDKGAFFLTGHATSWGTRTNPLTTIQGSSRVTASISGVTRPAVAVGNYVSFTGSPSVGGLRLGGHYSITAVSTGSFTFDAGTNATSSVTAGGGTTKVATYWGLPRNSLIADNVFINSNNPNDGLIVVLGPGNIVKNNKIEGGSYGALTFTSSFDLCSSCGAATTMVSGNVGPPGTGVASPYGNLAASGDNRNAHQKGFPPRASDASPLPANGGTP